MGAAIPVLVVGYFKLAHYPFRAPTARLFLFKRCLPIDGAKFTQYSSRGPLGGV